MVPSILILLIFSAILSPCVQAQHPPPLAYPSFKTWTIVTQNMIYPNQTTVEQWSYGQLVEVDSKAGVRCQYQVQELFPQTHTYTQTVVTNYTAGWRKSKVDLNSGSTVNCTDEAIDGKLVPGGGPYFAPAPDVLAKLVFTGFHWSGNTNCSVYQGTFTPSLDQTVFIQWYLDAYTKVPILLINQTTNHTSEYAFIHTTAFKGYHGLVNGMNEECTNPMTCGTDFCVANPTASSGSIGAALQWACSQTNSVNCGPVSPGGSRYYPNTLIAHGTYAFGQYYEANKASGSGSCNFNGAAELVTCSTVCHTCNASKTSTDQQLLAALKWVCGKGGIQSCSPILPGGKHFLPNTTKAHADWAFDVYYRAYKCIPGMKPCDFNGSGELVPCNT